MIKIWAVLCARVACDKRVRRSSVSPQAGNRGGINFDQLRIYWKMMRSKIEWEVIHSFLFLSISRELDPFLSSVESVESFSPVRTFWQLKPERKWKLSRKFSQNFPNPFPFSPTKKAMKGSQEAQKPPSDRQLLIHLFQLCTRTRFYILELA